MSRFSCKRLIARPLAALTGVFSLPATSQTESDLYPPQDVLLPPVP
jgi:hypothetical protein